MAKCPHCGHRARQSAGGLCPACGLPLAAPEMGRGAGAAPAVSGGSPLAGAGSGLSDDGPRTPISGAGAALDVALPKRRIPTLVFAPIAILFVFGNFVVNAFQPSVRLNPVAIPFAIIPMVLASFYLYWFVWTMWGFERVVVTRGSLHVERTLFGRVVKRKTVEIVRILEIGVDRDLAAKTASRVKQGDVRPLATYGVGAAVITVATDDGEEIGFGEGLIGETRKALDLQDQLVALVKKAQGFA